MTDDRPAQPGPPGDPPEPPGGRPVEERVAVVETRLDDLPTKGDLAKGLAKTERATTKLAIKLHTALIGQISALTQQVGGLHETLTQQVGSLHEALRGQITTYIMIVGIMVSGAVYFLDLRERDRQKVVEDVQQVQKAQGELLERMDARLDDMEVRQDRQEEMLGQIREEVRANREQMEANRSRWSQPGGDSAAAAGRRRASEPLAGGGSVARPNVERQPRESWRCRRRRWGKRPPQSA